MSRENEEQRPITQTFCGALRKEPNCKCLVLSVLIYGCLAAVTWCRCANVTKIVINFSKYPIKSTKHVSPCDDGYIYIPVAFMGMLYLVYLVECYHSPIRIDLLHAESQDSVLAKIMQLRLAQPTIWWKAVCYHYVRRKRQITRYRNGDNYTTTQVYYERVNTHAATSFYYYDYCGVKDISKNLMLETKIPITKIALTKGFAFSNIRSATEFEDTRSRFFAEQELRDDYMEMREGLDLGHNLDFTTLVAVLGNPWFTRGYVYWCLSALLLSWPLRVIIEYNTQSVDYQVTKLFGINYDTPTNGEPIHASASQLSQPGSYMLAPSYSEALLMDPAVCNDAEGQVRVNHYADRGDLIETDMVPSYSEALLYERAEQAHVSSVGITENAEVTIESQRHSRGHSHSSCECACHVALDDEFFAATSIGQQEDNALTVQSPNADLQGTVEDTEHRVDVEVLRIGSPEDRLRGGIHRDISEPNLRTRSEIMLASTGFLRGNGRSLESILEREEMSLASAAKEGIGRDKDCAILEGRRILQSPPTIPSSKTSFCLRSILKQKKRRYTLLTTGEFRNLVEADQSADTNDTTIPTAITTTTATTTTTVTRLDANKSTNFCNKECCALTSNHNNSVSQDVEEASYSKRLELRRSSTNSIDERKHRTSSSRTLIFASPIQELYHEDSFARKSSIPSASTSTTVTGMGANSTSVDDGSNVSVLTRLRRSWAAERDEGCSWHVQTNGLSNSCVEFTSARSSRRRTLVDIDPTLRRGSTLNGHAVNVSTKRQFGLTRSLTEKRPKPGRRGPYLPRSFTGGRQLDIESYRVASNGRRMNLNMETSL